MPRVYLTPQQYAHFEKLYAEEQAISTLLSNTRKLIETNISTVLLGKEDYADKDLNVLGIKKDSGKYFIELQEVVRDGEANSESPGTDGSD